MTLHRFFVPQGVMRSQHVELSGAVYEQIYRVLRMRPGDQFVLFDGNGFEYLATLGHYGKGSLHAQIVERRQSATEPRHRLELYLSLLNKADKYEWALQKCTELGVTHFVPVVAARSVTQHARGNRWERIVQEAAEQSGRLVVPTINDPLPLQAALKQATRQAYPSAESRGLAFMPEVGSDISLKMAIEKSGSQTVEGVALFIGPEGGFTVEEQDAARGMGVAVVALGERVLRAETAAVVATTIALLSLGDL